jgi:transcriptional regulator with XRE-family HTH domain
MTREALAGLCERSVSTVERWERGTTEPTLSDIRRMQKKSPGIVGLLFGAFA